VTLGRTSNANGLNAPILRDLSGEAPLFPAAALRGLCARY